MGGGSDNNTARLRKLLRQSVKQSRFAAAADDGGNAAMNFELLLKVFHVCPKLYVILFIE